jgi:hypothetical protein
MAHFQTELVGDLDALAAHLDQAILGKSVTAELQDATDRPLGPARMMVRGYERYSAFGGNRVSLTVSILAVGEQMLVSMVALGGSQAMFFKLNSTSERTFLERGVSALRSFAR